MCDWISWQVLRFAQACDLCTYFTSFNFLQTLQSNESLQKYSFVSLAVWDRLTSMFCCWHRLRTPKRFFSSKSQAFGLGQTIWADKFWVICGIFGRFKYQPAPILILWVPCVCFPLINHYFYKKTKPLYPDPSYLFGIGIWIWAAKN